ncbi:MAG: hypothetical protein AAF587_28100 [Bacteroidota bacterium]
MEFLSSPLSWQTGTLVFRNQSFHEVKQQLESQYGTEILMYHRKQNIWYPFWQYPPGGERHIQPEIRLTLFLYYQEEKDALMVRGIQLGPQA